MRINRAAIRRENLKALVDRLGSAAELNEKLGRKRTDPYLYALCAGIKLPSGLPRSPGPQLCEDIEDALELPRGWMSQEHADQDSPAQCVSTELKTYLEKILPAGDFELYRIDGTDMAPALAPGDVLLIDPTRTTPAAGIYLIEINGRRVVRRLSMQLDGSLTITADGMPGALTIDPATEIKGRAMYRISVKQL